MQKHTQNNFISYLLVLGTFFVLIFFTQDIYGQIQEQSDAIELQNKKLISQKSELTRLKQLQTDLLSQDSQIEKEITGFMGDFSDENIINHIYSYAQKINLGEERIIIREISLSGEEKSDIGFSKVDISLDIITSSEETLFAFLNYVTNQDSEFRFYISTFEYKLGSTNGNITVNIPLTFYYK